MTSAAELVLIGSPQRLCELIGPCITLAKVQGQFALVDFLLAAFPRLNAGVCIVSIVLLSLTVITGEHNECFHFVSLPSKILLLLQKLFIPAAAGMCEGINLQLGASFGRHKLNKLKPLHLLHQSSVM